MVQAHLYFPVAARTSDPVSSHMASEEHTASGRRQANIEIVLLYLRAWPGSTYRELAARIGGSLGHDEVNRRLNDLHEREEAWPDAEHKRECMVTGRSVQTWWPREER